ncbi:MAG: hypothetical protein HFJ58_02215 [Clostridia bacterium]|nr:hypothetical protein [Clostridia bacterium]
MEYVEEFKYLNLEVMKKKNANELPEDEKNFLIINLLDKNNNPCRFFVFTPDVMKKILSSSYVGLQVLQVCFRVQFTNNNWVVRLVDISE